MKEFVQLDSQGFYICQTVNYDWQGAIDIEQPILSKTQKAKFISETNSWDIKEISEWEKLETEKFEQSKLEAEEQMKAQEELNKANKLIEFYELASELGMM